jgi:hypothetical protein
VTDIIHVNQPGKLEEDGRRVRLGEMVMQPVDPEQPDGAKRLGLKLGRICVKLGNGLELSESLEPVPGCVALAVTADAAKRFGWPHPVNDKPKADLKSLQAIVGNPKYGQQEQITALREIRAIDPELGAHLAAANSWLEAA